MRRARPASGTTGTDPICLTASFPRVGSRHARITEPKSPLVTSCANANASENAGAPQMSSPGRSARKAARIREVGGSTSGQLRRTGTERSYLGCDVKANPLVGAGDDSDPSWSCRHHGRPILFRTAQVGSEQGTKPVSAGRNADTLQTHISSLSLSSIHIRLPEPPHTTRYDPHGRGGSWAAAAGTHSAGALRGPSLRSEPL